MKYLLTSLLLFISAAGFACSCFGPRDFCSAVSDSVTTDDYVILAKKISDKEHGMVVEVLKSYQTEIEHELIIIWGDLGWLCREYTSRFAVGDTFLFDIHKIGEYIYHPSEASGDFSLSFCGLRYLPVKNGNVAGHINQTDVVQTVTLETFNTFFEKDECFDIRSDNGLSIDAVVAPNPFKDITLIKANQRITELELYDMTGKLLFTEQSDRYFYQLDLSDFKYPSGMYIVRIVGYMSEQKLIKIIKIE